MIIDDKSRSVRVTASGYAETEPVRLAGFTITPSSTDLTVQFRDGGASGTIKWEAEADAGGGSHSHTFDPALPFKSNLYVTFSQAVANQSVCVHLLGS